MARENGWSGLFATAFERSRNAMLLTDGKRIVVDAKPAFVDDQEGFRVVAREMLRWRGYTVVGEAGCATSAMDATLRLEPDAVLLDVRLGDDNWTRPAPTPRKDTGEVAAPAQNARRAPPPAAIAVASRR